MALSHHLPRAQCSVCFTRVLRRQIFIHVPHQAVFSASNSLNIHLHTFLANSFQLFAFMNFVRASSFNFFFSEIKQSNNCIIKNNSFENSSYSGILIGKSSNTTLEDNHLEGNYNSAFHFQNTSSFFIQNNILLKSRFGALLTNTNNSRFFNNRCIYFSN